MFWQYSVLAAFTGSAIAGVVHERQLLAAAPTAVIKNGTVVGSTDLLNGVDNFMGIPFAIQPTGTLRLTNPSPLSTGFGTFTATGTPIACPFYIKASPTPSGVSASIQTLVNEVPLFQSQNSPVMPSGENCLNLNVQRSTGVTASSKVPVLIYIYGGGFEAGSSSMYDGTPIIKKADSLGLPLVYVAMNYRLAGLGFLPGKEMQGISNLGLKDQRLAIKWVQDNIAAFGGDPTQVTIWGESAGAISCFDQLIIDGGDINYNGGKLFRGAIMNSGSAVPALDISAPYNQGIYDQVVANAGCSGAADTLACLRSVSTETFNNAQFSIPGIFDYQSLHLAYFPRPDASDNFYPLSPELIIQNSSSAYANVPIIIGDQEDEGTLFAQVTSNITTPEELVDYLFTYFPEGNKADVQTLVDSYPADIAAGSPFRTGQFNNEYPEYKRLAAILGDIVFTLTRRVYLATIVPKLGTRAYSYLNTYLHNTSPIGTFHGSDILNTRTVPLSAVAQNATQEYFIAFTYYTDPNALGPAVVWPTWDDQNRKLLNFTSDAILIGQDNFREQQYETLSSLSAQGKLRA